jgi:hypothetical protein
VVETLHLAGNSLRAKDGRVRSFKNHLLAVVPFTALLVACVGDGVIVAPDGLDGGPPDAATADVSTKDATTDVATNDAGGDGSADAVADGSADAAVEAEAGKPQPTCVDQTMVSGAYNHTGCQANPSSPSPGGLFANANYVNAGLYGQPYCPIAYAIGSASVFQENGQTYFRYILTRKTSSQDPGTSTTGTYWIQTNGNGDLTVEEMCNT